MKKIFFITGLMVLFSCGNNDKQNSNMIESEKISTATEDLSVYKAELDSVATISQNTLLKNVGAAIENGGTENAVGFCNVMAMPFTDSLSSNNGVRISRITDRNRNPENDLKTESDKDIFRIFQENKSLIDSIITENSHLVYYKRINTAKPACIKCHGNPEADIDAATLAKINLLYPEDKATGYELNEFRGLWRIEKDKQ